MPAFAKLICTIPANQYGAPASSCPTCEYIGRPAEKTQKTLEGLYVCHTCGTQWRDLENQSDVSDHRVGVGLQSRRRPDVKWQQGNIATIFAPFFLTILLVTTLLLWPGKHLLQIDRFFNSNLSQDNLIISDVSVESFMNIGRPILVITGKVNNYSPFALNIPALNMYSGKQGSSGYFKWTYRAALQKLAPGASFRFRTTIPKPDRNDQVIELSFDNT